MHSVVYMILFSYLMIVTTQIEVEYQIFEQKPQQQCTYFEIDRYATPTHGLVNCSWYAPKACCKTTEVISVFTTMFPLYEASQACQNQLNYMMCFFCDPNQRIWYNQDTDHKVHICADFCRMVYKSCRSAQYNGNEIGESYLNETSFCEAQNFRLVEGKKNCFNFDPTVFGRTSLLEVNITIMFGVAIILMSLQDILS
ncbi:uncharacterized protein LOC134692112 [Mytilus trossulus]|uniref:uncharacterized protein LOC134692112 n=1 Tax=Mytilus trossulus TaxID=6551 RepID=UPI003004224E